MASSSRRVLVLRNRDFLTLWSGLLVSNLGDWINYVAMYAMVYQQTRSALALVGLRLVHLVPELLFAPLAGVFVDRWSRKKTLVVSPLISAVIVALLAFAHPVAAIYLAEFALTISAMFFEPAVSAAIPNIVSPEALAPANTLSRITSTIATLVGGLAGGVLISGVGATAAFGLDAVSFLVIAMLVSTVRVREETSITTVASIDRELREGIRYVRERPLLATVVLASALFVIAPSSIFTVGIVFAQSVLHAGSTGYGILLAGLGTGSFIGAVWMVADPVRLRGVMAFVVTGIALGMAIGLMGLSRSLAPAVGLYGVAGCMSMINGVSGVTLLQRLVPDRFRGRVFGAASSLNHLAVSAGTLLIAVGVGPLGSGGMIAVSGAIATLTGLWALRVVLSQRAT